MTPRIDALLMAMCLLLFPTDHLAFRPITNDFTARSFRLKVSIAPQSISSRVQKIKDISLQKEILRDITSAEFALKLEVKGRNAQTTNIDYDGLISKLDRHLEYLSGPSLSSGDLGSPLVERIEVTIKSLYIAAANKISGAGAPPTTAATATNTQSPKENPSLAELRQSFKVIVREDGTVDWDGAATAGREVAKFGSELWERINGKEETEGMPSIQELLGQATVIEPVTEEIAALRVNVEAAKTRFQSAVNYRDDVKSKLRQDRKDGRVLSKDDLKSLKRLDARVKELEKRLTLFTLDLDIERICAYLRQELESSIEPSDQRLYVAEVALAEKQLYSMVSGLQLESEASRALGNAPSPMSDVLLAGVTEGDFDFDPAGVGAEERAIDLVSLVDDNELALVVRQVNDLKSRLGLDAQSNKQKVDWGTLGVVARDTGAKVKEGLAFFGGGTKVLLNDILYAWALIAKAVQGYTLKAREVNAMRRTGKDLLTLIPFTIILIIPLTPVGHVLVFSFIQRFLPDFFPSCYTEKRLNLIRLYSEIERKNDDDILGSEPEFSLLSWTPVANLLEKVKIPDTLLASMNSVFALQSVGASTATAANGTNTANTAKESSVDEKSDADA